MIKIYGSTHQEKNQIIHTDTANTLLGAKQYATRHEIDNVSVRIGYNVTLLWYKNGDKWHEYKHLNNPVQQEYKLLHTELT